MPTATGTGFFISPDGWFVTAAHVVTDNNGNPRSDLGQAVLEKEPGPDGWSSMLHSLSLCSLDQKTDFALLKVDFAANAKKDLLQRRSGFPHVEVSTRCLDEGEPVYSLW
jgi:serine protease Do